VTLSEVVTGELAGKFGEISLFNHHVDFELESASNSNSTSPWAIACEPAAQPSLVVPPSRERSTCGPRNPCRARTGAPSSRRAGKEPIPEYNSDSDTAPGHASDSNPLSGFYSDSAYEFDFGLDPEDPESEDNSTEHPLSGPASGLVITSTPVGRFVYWTDCKPADLISGDSRYVAYIDSLRSRREHHSPELTRTPQLRWRAPSPVLAPLIAKSSWLPATPLDHLGRLQTSTLKTSPQTSCLPKHLQTRPPPTGTLNVSVTGSATNGAGGSETTSPSATWRKLSKQSRAEYTLPLSNVSCQSQRSHARLRAYTLEKSSPSSLKMPTSCGSTTGQPASSRQEPRQRSYKSQC
jgi:hypothetical protein